jgi:SagB-type dehydrogenase family enzyme
MTTTVKVVLAPEGTTLPDPSATLTSATPPAATGLGEGLALLPGVRVERLVDGMVRLYRGRRGVALGRLAPAIDPLVDLLASGICTEELLTEHVLRVGPELRLLDLQLLLQRLRSGGWLDRILTFDGAPVLTVRPVAPPPAEPAQRAVPPAPGPPDGPGRVRISRFSLLRAGNEGLLMESPLAHVVLVLHDPRALAVIAALASGGITDVAGELRDAVTTVLLEHSFATGREGEEDFTHLMWAPHELWFHARSRAGRHDLPYGGTYWAESLADPPPVVRPSRGTPAISLFQPDLVALRRDDPTLTTVLEDRHSVRDHDDSVPLTLRQLGEFLFRTARVRHTMREGRNELSDRPYPSGGACHELEIYLVVRNVDGVEPGLYHYNPAGHSLETVAGPAKPLTALSELARISSLMTTPPQVTLVIAARPGRVMWKYQSMAYALTLKHVGVLYQVMYSVATAMGLAACALGGGDSDAFAAATGLSYLAETSVGEFILGSRHVDGKKISDGLPA